MTDGPPECDHCSIRIRSIACRAHTTAFGVACIACRQILRETPDADIETVDPQPISRADRKSWFEDEASEVSG